MSITEKLKLNDEIDARNKIREKEFIQMQKVEIIHRIIEAYAETIHGYIDMVAQDYGLKRSEVIDLLIDTLYAVEQIKAQEG